VDGIGEPTGARFRGESGESLAELLVAIAIIGIAVITIVGSMAAAIGLSGQQRVQANDASLLVQVAEAVKAKPYSSCTSATPDYSLVLTDGVTVPSGYTVTVGTVRTLDPATGATAPCPSTDTKVQLVKITVSGSSANGFLHANTATVSVDVTKRSSN
jgi:Tfp pilus assembly protein PilV